MNASIYQRFRGVVKRVQARVRHAMSPAACTPIEALGRLVSGIPEESLRSVLDEWKRQSFLLAKDLEVGVKGASRRLDGEGKRCDRLLGLQSCLETGNLTRSQTGLDILKFVYLLIRLKRPRVVVETGTFDGRFASVMLEAMEKNNCGYLVSVDLPARVPIPDAIGVALPAGCDPGWVIPDRLRGRQRMVTGDARDMLPPIFEEYPEVDLFVHDSLHTAEHMLWEYQIAWRHLTGGGVLLSDDIFANDAFARFCRSVGRRYVHLGTFGGVVKVGHSGGHFE